MVRFENVGAIFMASDITTTSCTKCMDIRYKYVNEYVDDRVVKIVFVKWADNDIDILKKFECRASHEAFKENGW